MKSADKLQYFQKCMRITIFIFKNRTYPHKCWHVVTLNYIEWLKSSKCLIIYFILCANEMNLPGLESWRFMIMHYIHLWKNKDLNRSEARKRNVDKMNSASDSGAICVRSI